MHAYVLQNNHVNTYANIYLNQKWYNMLGNWKQINFEITPSLSATTV